MKSEPTNQHSRRLTSNSSGMVSIIAVVHSVTMPVSFSVHCRPPTQKLREGLARRRRPRRARLEADRLELLRHLLGACHLEAGLQLIERSVSLPRMPPMSAAPVGARLHLERSLREPPCSRELWQRRRSRRRERGGLARSHKVDRLRALPTGRAWGRAAPRAANGEPKLGDASRISNPPRSTCICLDPAGAWRLPAPQPGVRTRWKAS